MITNWTGIGNRSLYMWLPKYLNKKLYAEMAFQHYDFNEAGIRLTL
jgi:hypothetical protein